MMSALAVSLSLLVLHMLVPAESTPAIDFVPLDVVARGGGATEHRAEGVAQPAPAGEFVGREDMSASGGVELVPAAAAAVWIGRR